MTLQRAVDIILNNAPQREAGEYDDARAILRRQLGLVDEEIPARNPLPVNATLRLINPMHAGAQALGEAVAGGAGRPLEWPPTPPPPVDPNAARDRFNAGDIGL